MSKKNRSLIVTNSSGFDIMRDKIHDIVKKHYDRVLDDVTKVIGRPHSYGGSTQVNVNMLSMGDDISKFTINISWNIGWFVGVLDTYYNDNKTKLKLYDRTAILHKLCDDSRITSYVLTNILNICCAVDAVLVSQVYPSYLSVHTGGSCEGIFFYQNITMKASTKKLILLSHV